MPKLIETFTRKTSGCASGTAKHWDTEVKGFALFVGKRAKTWYFQRDVGGRTRRVLIGRWPTINAAVARQTAQSLLLESSRGAGKSLAIGAPTLETALETYLVRPKLHSTANANNVRSQMERHLRDWMRLPLDEITRGMTVQKHAAMAATPSEANHALRNFRSIWNHARRSVDLPECPTRAIEWYPEEPDGRLIEDLREWRRAVDGLDNPIHAACYRLLLFTGFRRSEALALRWRDVHPDCIHLPMTKNGRPFDFPVVEAHREILEPMRGLSREWVFPAPKSAAGHLQSPARLPWSPHAHRRTFATVAVEAGVIEDVVGRLLNHTPLSVTGRRYARPSLEALRPAVQTACDELVRRGAC